MYKFLKQIKKIIRTILFYCKHIFKYIFYFLKVDNKKITFINFNGKGYGDNPKYIAESLLKNNIDCKMVWLVIDKNEAMPDKIKKVKYGSIRAYYEMATAKIWVSNTRNYKFAIKKKEQFYIQTWHASFGYKKVEGEIEELLDSKYIKEAKRDAKDMDIILSDNDISTNLYKHKFWYDGEILNIGVPRNDILYRRPDNIVEKVYKYFNIPKYKKIIIYEPTFRENFDFDMIKFDYNKLLEVAKEKYKEEFVLLIRLHPNISIYDKFINYSENVINATKYPDNQELLAASYIGITDYSSISFEMAMIDKPVFLLCKDIKEYQKKERGLNFSFNELPFVCAISEEELFENIKEFSKEQYQEKCNEFFDKVNLVKTTEASDKVAEIIKSKIN